jgi:tetratricopeptide (TPR) repeat protein
MALYDAFVSYSHAKDKPIAAALQSVVQKLGRPWYRRRALRVFRDDTSLSATPSLWPSIEQALGQSRFLILIASPEAAASIWVNKEVAYWLEHKSVDTLLVAVTDGELAWDESAVDFGRREGTPLPPALAGRFASEPKWVDLRAYRDGADKRDAKFTELAADFAAAVHGMPKEDLLSQEVRQQRRALTLAWSAAGSLLVLAGFAGWQWKAAVDAERLAVEQKSIAQQQRDRAETTLSAASQTANDLVYKLAAEFRTRKGMPIELVRSVLEQAQELQRKLAERGESTPLLRHAEGAALNELAIALQEIGDLKTALEAAERARALVEKAVEDAPTVVSWQDNLAISHQTIGNILRGMGRHDEALASYRKSLAISERLAADHPDDRKWQAQVASACTLIARVLDTRSTRQEALEFFQRSHSIWQKLVAAEPGRTEWQRRLAMSYRDIADALSKAGKRVEAFAAIQSSIAINEKLAEANPDNAVLQQDLTFAYDRLAGLLAVTGQRAAAIEAYRKSLAITEKLAAADPGNGRTQASLAIAYRNLADVLSDSAGREEAVGFYRKAIEIGTKLTASDPGNADWRLSLAISYRHLGDTLWESGASDAALDAYRKSLAIDEALVASDPGNAVWQRDLAIDYLKIANVLLAERRHDEAREMLRKKLAIDERLAAAAPNDLDVQSALAASYAKLADVLSNIDRLDEALEYSRKTLAIRQRLLAADPTNTQWQRNLAYDHYRIGNLFYEWRKYEEALVSFKEGVAVAEKLAASDAGNLAWQRDVSTGYWFIDFAYTAMGRREEALVYAWKAIAIREKITAADPRNARWLRDLANVYRDAGRLLMALGRRDEARDPYRKCFDARLKVALFDPRDRGNRDEVAQAVFELAQAGEGVQVLLAQVGDTVRRAAAGGKFGENENAWIKAVAHEVAFKYVEHARDEFYAERPERAVEQVVTALKIAPSYPYAPLWLHVYRMRAGQDDAEEFAANAEAVSRAEWPWPVIAFFLGQSDAEALRAAALSPDQPSARNAQVCEVDFFLGIERLVKGAPADARPLLQAALERCPHDYLEYEAAKLELQRLDRLAAPQAKQ